MKICFHTHCFPDGLAPRAISVLAGNARPFGYSPHTDGTASGAEKALRAAGIGMALVCNIATNTRQERKVNGFAISVDSAKGFFRAAGSVHPDSENAEEEFALLHAAGIKGIKIHPDYVGVELTDARFDRIFALAEEYGMFVVTHAGFDPVSPSHVHVTADGLLEVVKRRPKLKLIAAHMGGPGQAEEVVEKLVGTSVFFDTSLSSIRPGERDALLTILREHDDSRILFGTDTPWTDPANEVAFLENSGLPERKLENIFYRNAAGLLRL